MPTTPGSFIPRFAFWNPSTWAIPELYWDTFSQEQRIHAICKQLGKVIAYADMLGVNVDDIAARLKAIEDGELNDVIVAAVEEWFEENEPTIISAIDALNEALPIADFDSVNTVKAALDADGTAISAIEGALPIADFNDTHTVSDAIDDLAELLPDTEFDSVNTVKAALDTINAKFPIATSDIADANVTWAKLANDAKNNCFDKSSKMIFIGDSYNVGTGSNTDGWGELVIAQLGLTDVINCKMGGAGFDADSVTDNEFQGMDYPDAVQYLGTNMTESDRLKVKKIVFQGGWNDYTKSNVGMKMNLARSRALTYFPNAQLYCILAICGSRANTITRVSSVRQDYNNNSKRYGYAYAECFNLPFFFSTPSNDGTHPTETCMNYMAGFIAGVVLNGYQTDYESRSIIGHLRRFPKGDVSGVNAATVNGGTPYVLQAADSIAFVKRADSFYLAGIFTGSTPWAPIVIKWNANGKIEINQILGVSSGTGSCYWPDLIADIFD